MYDLLIRGGRVVDGTGAPAVDADVAIRGDHIVAVGPALEGQAAEVVDATGAIVTPGFVDIHTHYDGQATWDQVLDPSASHGVTTVVMGNCGVGFAPVRPGREQWLIQLMEGVEDIPGTALAEGITWGWESFPQYLEVLDRRHFSMDVAAQVPHGAVRGYVMGDRGAANEPATTEDVAAMGRIVQEALEAGAVGFSTSRTVGHLAVDGTPVPGTFAAADELIGIAAAVRRAGGAVFEVAPSGIIPMDDPAVRDAELGWMSEVAGITGAPVTFIVLQNDAYPTLWRQQLAAAADRRAAGVDLRPLVAGRPFGVLFGWDARHPFLYRPTYRAVAHLPLDERVAVLRQPEVRAAILAEDDGEVPATEAMFHALLGRAVASCYVLGDPPDYEPTPDRQVRAIAAARGITPTEAAYDLLTDGDGTAFLIRTLFNYTDGDGEVLREQLEAPGSVLGLDDGGAHCSTICDASIPTYMLTHWARDRTRGPRLPLEAVVRKQTSETAELYGFTDRGVVAVGARADLNVIDLDRLRLHPPRAVFDLPAGGRRLLQDATGYRATTVAGVVTRRDDRDTGARPGRLLRRG